MLRLNHRDAQMAISELIPSALIGGVASARSMTPMAELAAAGLAGARTPGRLVLLDHPLLRFGALAMGAGEVFGDKMASAPDRIVPLGLLARVLSAGIAGAALAPRERERSGAAVAVGTAIPLAYLTLAGRKRAMTRLGQTRSSLIEDAVMVAVGVALVAAVVRPRQSRRTARRLAATATARNSLGAGEFVDAGNRLREDRMQGSNGRLRSVLKAGNGVLLAFPIALFAFALATDITYLRTAELQWTNVSAWSIAVALLFGVVALAFALVGALFSLRSRRQGLRLLYAAALAVMCILGLINAFKHSQDGWSSVGPLGVVLSALTAGAALVAGSIAYSGAMDEGDA